MDTMPTPNDPTNEINNLQAQVQMLNERLEKSMSDHRSDIERIGEALIDEANERGWCSIYDEFVKNLNRSLTEELPVRRRSYDVDVTVTYTVTVTVSAVSEEEAEDEAADLLSNELAFSMHQDGHYMERTDINAERATEV